MVREGNDESIWARLHARQALVLGILTSLAFIVVLAFPLLIILADPAISTTATIVVYAIGLAGDVIAGIGLLLIALRCSARAARGELFALPLVTPIVDAFFRVRRP